MHERKTNTVFSLPLQLVTGRTNGRDFENAPSLSLSVFHSTTPSSFFFHFFSPPSSLPTCLQMANAILDVFFLHIKPEVTAALFLNQPQMCRHSYLTTGADGTLSEAGSEKYKKKTSVVQPETTLAPPGEPLRSEKQNKDTFAKFFVQSFATYSNCSPD